MFFSLMIFYSNTATISFCYVKQLTRIKDTSIIILKEKKIFLNKIYLIYYTLIPLSLNSSTTLKELIHTVLEKSRPRPHPDSMHCPPTLKLLTRSIFDGFFTDFLLSLDQPAINTYVMFI